MSVYTRVHVHTYIHTYIHTYTHIHTHTYTCIHVITYIHTYIHTLDLRMHLSAWLLAHDLFSFQWEPERWTVAAFSSRPEPYALRTIPQAISRMALYSTPQLRGHGFSELQNPAMAEVVAETCTQSGSTLLYKPKHESLISLFL